MKGRRHVYKILIRKPEGRSHLDVIWNKQIVSEGILRIWTGFISLRVGCGKHNHQ
jgi:hypothetical protein